MKALTARQQEILEFIKGFIRNHKYPPTIREIAGNFSISVKGAYDHVKALEKKEQIKCDLGRSRAMEIIDDGSESVDFIKVPLIGHVAAGIPLFAEENWDGVLKVSSANLSQGKHFALRVQGDSMEGAGILDGDTAIFEQRQHADNGDIVVAMINDEAVTLKRFYKEKNRVKLKAENPIYPPIYTQNVRVLGKLSCIIRNYE
ncbi:MAG: transcriptional repressor LexA [Spirochaetales bacterium]|jgi:repressor LexA|nr:transcriptional repressor LexA [Spirochaetales bacterium]